MKKLILLLLLLPSTCFAELKLVGPDTCKQGETVKLKVSGLPGFTPGVPVEEAFKWADDLRLLTFSPKDGAVEFESDVGYDPVAKSYRMRLEATPTKPGVYVVVVKLGEEITGHRLEVTGTGPQPDPNPDPTPTPVAKGLRVLYLEEDKERNLLSVDQKSALPIQNSRLIELLNRKCTKDGEVPAWRLLDDDYTKEGLANLPSGFIGLYEAGVRDSKGVRPWLVIQTDAGIISRENFKTATEAFTFFEGLK